MDVPDVRYARSGDVAIAYQVVGEGPVDLVYVSEFVSNLVYGWEWPLWRSFCERLAASFRVILFDKRGTGISDLGGQFPALDTRMDDIRAVLDAVGSSSAVLLSAHDGCALAALYAATYPERTRGLVLFQPASHHENVDELLADLRTIREGWGTQEFCDLLLADNCPTLHAIEDERVRYANRLRVGASPAVAYALNRAWFETDIRDVLYAIRVPTLVLYRGAFAEGLARDVIARIRDVEVAALPGEDWWGIFLSPEIVEEIERFVEGRKAPAVPDTLLATLLFTDIVGSTAHAARLGDREWREQLSRHHSFVRRELARFRGQERDTAGDGFFATFDGPARAIRCAQVLVEGVHELGLEIRAGVHTGECELHEGKVAGIAVVTGARVAAQAQPGEVLVTRTVTDLVAGTGLTFDERGEHELKGVPGIWRLYAVADG